MRRFNLHSATYDYPADKTDDPGARVMVRRSSSVDYWDGEK